MVEGTRLRDRQRFPTAGGEDSRQLPSAQSLSQNRIREARQPRQTINPVSDETVCRVPGAWSTIGARIVEILIIDLGVRAIVRADVAVLRAQTLPPGVVRFKHGVVGEALAQRGLPPAIDAVLGVVDVVGAAENDVGIRAHPGQAVWQIDQTVHDEFHAPVSDKAGFQHHFTVNNTTGSGLDISNWRLVQANSANTYNLPLGTVIPEN